MSGNITPLITRIPRETSEPIRDVEQAKSEWVYFGETDSDLDSNLEANFSASLHAVSSETVLSVDGSPIVRAAWELLPWELAVLLFSPEKSGRFIIRKNWLLPILSTSSTWEALAMKLEKEGWLLLNSINDSTINSEERHLQSLAPTNQQPLPDWLLNAISARLDQLEQSTVVSQADFRAIEAGVLLWHQQLDASHEVSQSVQGEGHHAAGDYWHAIMHRMEPDDSNSKYWFQHVGYHPVFEKLPAIAKPILENVSDPQGQQWGQQWLSKIVATDDKWEPFAFVDFCSACRRGSNTELTIAAQRIQQWEMLYLLEQTVQDAFGKR